MQNSSITCQLSANEESLTRIHHVCNWASLIIIHFLQHVTFIKVALWSSSSCLVQRSANNDMVRSKNVLQLNPEIELLMKTRPCQFDFKQVIDLRQGNNYCSSSCKAGNDIMREEYRNKLLPGSGQPRWRACHHNNWLHTEICSFCSKL